MPFAVSLMTHYTTELRSHFYLMGDGHKPKESCCLCGSPFTTGTIWQGHHYCLQLITCNFELADTLEFHGFSCQIFLGCHSISKDIQQESPTAWCMHSECNNVTHHRLQNRTVSTMLVISLFVLYLTTHNHLADETQDKQDAIAELLQFCTFS